MTYLYSSFTGLPDRHLDGYCFVGVDYVAGEDGRKAFLEATGQDVPPGEDGNYLVVAPQGAGHQIGTDGAGFKKVFYFSIDGVWCISDSLYDLAHHLTDHGVPLSANMAQVAAYTVDTTIAKQISSFRTVFNEVLLLPHDAVLDLNNGSLQMRRLDRGRATDYEHALADYLNTWVRRFETLIADGRVNTTVDLTGGADSRSVFALMHTAVERLRSSDARLTLKSNTNDRWRADFDAATHLAAEYGYAINKRHPRAGGLFHTTQSSYEQWRSLAIGIYMPIYFPGEYTHAFDVQFHGGGGECHRPFYLEGTPESLLASLRQIRQRALVREWKSQLLETITELASSNPRVDPLTLHYREFRHRSHVGRVSQYRVALMPLGSRLLELATDHLGATDSAQVNFDIMDSLVPGLKDHPYDDPSKAPTDINRAQSTIVAVESRADPGTVYAGQPTARHTVEPIDGRERMRLLATEYDGAKSPAVRKIAGRRFIRKADAVMAHGLKHGSFRHATQAKRISAVLTAAFVMSTANRGS